MKLVSSLCQRLEAEGIDYCHWKSNNALDRSASGENDLDLLVRRADASRFAEILSGLGFKRALAPAGREMPAVVNYFGFDEEADRWVHVHAHYQLVLGHDMTKNYRLPIEDGFLDSAVQGPLFRVPAPDFEFIVFVIRMVLKHSTWDVILGRQGRLKASEREELAWLEKRISDDRVDEILEQSLPYIDRQLFKSCRRALRPDCSNWSRIGIGQRLQVSLQANARHSMAVDVWLKLWRRGVRAVGRRLLRRTPKYRLESGGALIAIVGGDGAGKSTAVAALANWLSRHFEVATLHMGKPAWSWTTLTVRAVLKVGQLLGLYPVETSFQETLEQESRLSPAYPWLLRELLRARDRFLLYLKAQRAAGKGAFIILDRFPLPHIQLMDGPRGERFVDALMTGSQGKRGARPPRGAGFVERLVNREENYYRQISPPDVLFVLRLAPEIAVQRRPDENPEFVWERNREIWQQSWAESNAQVIDASQAKTDVLAELKARVWAQL